MTGDTLPVTLGRGPALIASVVSPAFRIGRRMDAVERRVLQNGPSCSPQNRNCMMRLIVGTTMASTRPLLIE